MTQQHACMLCGKQAARSDKNNPSAVGASVVLNVCALCLYSVFACVCRVVYVCVLRAVCIVQVMDKHLGIICKQHLETKFVKVSQEKGV